MNIRSLTNIIASSWLILAVGCKSQEPSIAEVQIAEVRSASEKLSEQCRLDINDLREQVRKLEDEVRSFKEHSSTNREESSQVTATAVTPTSLRLSGNEIDDAFLGGKDAPVVLFAFIDFQSELGNRFVEGVIPELDEQFIKSGKLQLVLRDFPISTNLHSYEAATFAHCAGEQGRYWQAVKLLAVSANEITEGHFAKLALSIDPPKRDKFNTCISSDKYKKEIQSDISDALSLGAKGSPSFFVFKRAEKMKIGETVSGVLIRGAQPKGVFLQEINATLSRNQ